MLFSISAIHSFAILATDDQLLTCKDIGFTILYKSVIVLRASDFLEHFSRVFLKWVAVSWGYFYGQQDFWKLSKTDVKCYQYTKFPRVIIEEIIVKSMNFLDNNQRIKLKVSLTFLVAFTLWILLTGLLTI